jgi:hypothetical protein
MSENTPMNSSDALQSGGARTLARLELEPLTVNRDELFFQAGYAAGLGARSLPRFWLSTAAALLLICLGLAAALIEHSASSPRAGLARNGAVGTSPADDQAGQWQQLASSAGLRPGRLTAMGFIETPPGETNNSADSINKQDWPAVPSTYFELLRQQEG